MLREDNTLRSWATTAAILGAAVGIRWFLWDVTPGRPFFIYYSAVLAAAFFCGWREATVAMVITTLLALRWNAGAPNNPVPSVLAIITGTYILTCGAVIYSIHALKREVRMSRSRNMELRTVNGEMQHRLRNVITVINTLAAQTIKAGGSPDKVTATLHARLTSLAGAYDGFTTKSHGASLVHLINRVVRPLTPDGDSLTVHADSPNVVVPYESATTFAMVLHELATNAVKHGAWKNGDGKVSIGYFADESNKLWFQWCERCTNQCSPPNGKFKPGVGLRLIQSMGTVEHQLSGDGVRCTIEFDLGKPS